MHKETEILKVNNLSIRYNSSEGVKPILKDITFFVPKGKTLGITGASGSGKSMTALSLMGLTWDIDNFNVSGDILFEGINLAKLSDAQWTKIRGRRISMIFQHPQAALNPLIKCGDQIAEAILTHSPATDKKTAHNKTMDILHQVGLNDAVRIYQAYPHELSGGQLQRVVIGMAISNKPDIIIADEPTSSLDAGNASEILKLLKKIQLQYDITLILITHDILVLQRISDQIILLKDGTIEADFDNRGAFLNGCSDYTKKYLELASPNREYRKVISSYQPLLLDIKHISKTFTTSRYFPFYSKVKQTVLQDVNLELKSGSMLGLLGASGSGKTTLGKIISGIIDASEGIILFHEKIVSKFKISLDKGLRKNIQLIFQDSYTSLNPKQTVGQMLNEVISFYQLAATIQERDKIIDRLMDQLLLDKNSILNKYNSQLSGGQRQRVALARTLLLKPEIIIFDESLSALDQFNQKNIIELIIHLQSEYGFSGIFISHDANLVRSLCTEVMIIDQGKIVEHGPVAEIFNHPKHEITKSLLYSNYDLK